MREVFSFISPWLAYVLGFVAGMIVGNVMTMWVERRAALMDGSVCDGISQRSTGTTGTHGEIAA